MNTRKITKEKPSWNKLFVPLVLLLLFVLSQSEARSIILSSLADAYFQVSVFVAATLLIFYFIEEKLKLNTDDLLRKYKKWQIPIAAFMGMIPGCGGAIIVMTQYVSGRLGFGAVVAVLCATMGDAAFLLIAKEPKTAMLIFLISIMSGIIFGYLVEYIHGYDFLRGDKKPALYNVIAQDYTKSTRGIWILVFIPGIIIGVLQAFQVEINDGLVYLGGFGAMLSVVMWVLSPHSGPVIGNRFNDDFEQKIWYKTITDTNFVTVWVIFAFLVFELAQHWIGFDLKSFFNTYKFFTPLFACLVGFLPGCGPQIVVTTLYLQGYVPLSAQVANAISNDGDALFPAIAVAPKVALIATIYTGIPALIVGYIFYYLGY